MEPLYRSRDDGHHHQHLGRHDGYHDRHLGRYDIGHHNLCQHKHHHCSHTQTPPEPRWVQKQQPPTVSPCVQKQKAQCQPQLPVYQTRVYEHWYSWFNCCSYDWWCKENVFRLVHLCWLTLMLTFLVWGWCDSYISYDKFTYWTFTLVAAWFTFAFVGYFKPAWFYYDVVYVLPMVNGVVWVVFFGIVALIINDSWIFLHNVEEEEEGSGDTPFWEIYVGDKLVHSYVPMSVFVYIVSVAGWIHVSYAGAFYGTTCSAWRRRCRIIWFFVSPFVFIGAYMCLFDPQVVYSTDLPFWPSLLVAMVVVGVVNGLLLLVFRSKTQRYFSVLSIPDKLLPCDNKAQHEQLERVYGRMISGPLIGLPTTIDGESAKSEPLTMDSGGAYFQIPGW
jgi:hypothetical protein